MDVDLQELLQNRSRGWPAPEPDLNQIRRRGSRLRRRRGAAIGVAAMALVGVSVWSIAVFSAVDSSIDRRNDLSRRAVPGWESLSPSLVKFPEQDRAASFAVLAAADAGLIDPGGRTWDYLRVEGVKGEWTATYEIINCLPPGSTGEICPRSGELVTASFNREGDLFIVREVSGAASDEERIRLLGTNLPVPSGPPRWEDVAVTGPGGPGGTWSAGWGVWIGPIPAPGELHVACRVEARDADGKVLARTRLTRSDPPRGNDDPLDPTSGEASRDGNVPWVTQLSPRSPSDYTAALRCSTYWWTDGPELGDLTSGGYRASDVRIRYTAPVYDAAEPVALQIHFRTGWASFEFPGGRECTWNLLDESHKVMASQTFPWFFLSPTQRNNRLTFEDLNGLPAEVEFSCGPRRDDPTLANDASIESFRPGDGAVLVTWEVSWPHDAWGASVCTLTFTTSSGKAFEKERIESGTGMGGGRRTIDMPFKVPDGIDPEDVTDVVVSCVPWSPGDRP